jgi:hypothetical protein
MALFCGGGISPTVVCRCCRCQMSSNEELFSVVFVVRWVYGFCGVVWLDRCCSIVVSLSPMHRCQQLHFALFEYTVQHRCCFCGVLLFNGVLPDLRRRGLWGFYSVSVLVLVMVCVVVATVKTWSGEEVMGWSSEEVKRWTCSITPLLVVVGVMCWHGFWLLCGGVVVRGWIWCMVDTVCDGLIRWGGGGWCRV